jgi:hypothetical protein
MPYTLPPIPYLRLRCTLEAQAPARLPPFHGSLLRGAFGHALRRAVCALGPAEECARCRLRGQCVYPRLFEPLLEPLVGEGREVPPFLRGIATAPRPYVFEPAGGEVFAPGEPLRFDLLLFGRAIELFAYALLAIERMAPAGLGAARVPFRLSRVEAARPEGGFETLFLDGRPPAERPPTPAFPSLAVPEGPRATLRFVTPANLQLQQRAGAPPAFRALAFAMLRRALETAALHVPEAQVDWTFRPLLDRADAVRIARSDLRWVDGRRWSNRQGRETPLAGWVGQLELEGDLAPFGPLLRTAEILHLGKGATFGLGRVAVG